MAKRLTEKQRFRRDERRRKKKEKRENRLRPKRELKQRIEAWKLKVIERDNWTEQMTGKKLLTRKECHPHHIISLQSVLRKYPELLDNINNGILLNYYTHKAAPNSPHQGGFEFVLWLEKNKPEQYNHLKEFLLIKNVTT